MQKLFNKILGNLLLWVTCLMQVRNLVRKEGWDDTISTSSYFKYFQMIPAKENSHARQVIVAFASARHKSPLFVPALNDRHFSCLLFTTSWVQSSVCYQSLSDHCLALKGFLNTRGKKMLSVWRKILWIRNKVQEEENGPFSTRETVKEREF